MSWWEDQIGNAGDVMQSPLFGTAVFAALTSLAKTLRNIRNKPYGGVLATLGEALSCSFLSLMLVQAGTLWLDLSPNAAIMVGVFTGWIGTAQLTRYISLFIRKCWLLRF